jgi:6-phospho-3-hexuloisomerase
MSSQKLILDRLTTILSETDNSNPAKLLQLVDEAGRIFIGDALGTCRLQREHDW